MSSGRISVSDVEHVKCLPELIEDAAAGLWPPPGLGPQLQGIDLFYCFWNKSTQSAVRSTLGDCEVTRTNMMWRRHLLNMAR